MSARMREKTKVARHPFSDLSFVRDNPGRCNGRDFWTPVSSDDYDADCLLGQALGQEYVACSRRHEDYGQPTLPRHIVKRMIERGDFSGLHIGFFGAIASAAMGPQPPEPVPYELLSEDGRIMQELAERWRNGARFAPPVDG
jgi:hypothetical protein